jgi:hypothetical protein
MTALHLASLEGHTETALALVKAGADVRCKTKGGSCSHGCIVVSVGLSQCRGGRSVLSGWELQGVPVWLCSSTALHCASQNGKTETAMVLVKAGADVHGKDNNGYGFSGLHPLVGWFLTLRGGRSVLCRLTALHYASSFGHTETALALAKAGADVHCTNNIGYGFSGLCPRVGWCATVLGGRSVRLGWS